MRNHTTCRSVKLFAKEISAEYLEFFNDLHFLSQSPERSEFRQLPCVPERSAVWCICSKKYGGRGVNTFAAANAGTPTSLQWVRPLRWSHPTNGLRWFPTPKRKPGDQINRVLLRTASNNFATAYGRSVVPIRKRSTSRAAPRPSSIAQTTRPASDGSHRRQRPCRCWWCTFHARHPTNSCLRDLPHLNTQLISDWMLRTST